MFICISIWWPIFPSIFKLGILVKLCHIVWKCMSIGQRAEDLGVWRSYRVFGGVGLDDSSSGPHKSLGVIELHRWSHQERGGLREWLLVAGSGKSVDSHHGRGKRWCGCLLEDLLRHGLSDETICGLLHANWCLYWILQMVEAFEWSEGRRDTRLWFILFLAL